MSLTYQIYDPSKNVENQPDYYQTIRYIFQHIDFPISEDEAYIITNLFIEKWDESSQKSMTVIDFQKYVFENCRSRVKLFLSKEKIYSVVQLIMEYLYSIGQFRQ